MITWHETIESIRTKPEYKDLVEKAYFEKNLPLNVERFKNSEEFIETLKYIKKYAPNAKTILDIGSGNGISAIAFALNGYDVISIEPDPSDTIGAGAIRQLKDHYNLKNIEIKEVFAEDLTFDKPIFDIVYARQSMHHANDLNKFVKEAVKGLKKDGLFFSVRDHVLYNHDEDKKWFLETHPLHKYYGGENAFTEKEYLNAILNAGLSLIKELKHYDSVINYFPMKQETFVQELENYDKMIGHKIARRLPIIGRMPLLISLYKKYRGGAFDEKKVPGRMYSFIAIKK